MAIARISRRSLLGLSLAAVSHRFAQAAGAAEQRAYAAAIMKAYSQGRYLAAGQALDSSDSRLTEWAAFVGDEAKAIVNAPRRVDSAIDLHDARESNAIEFIASRAKGLRVLAKELERRFGAPRTLLLR